MTDANEVSASLIEVSYTEADTEVARAEESGGIEGLLDRLRGGSLDSTDPFVHGLVRCAAASRLADRAAGSAHDKLAIVEADGIGVLVTHLQEQGGPDSAARALGNLALNDDRVKSKIVQAGGIAPLVARVRKYRSEEASRTLGILADGNEAAQKLIVQEGGIEALIEVIKEHRMWESASTHAQKEAAAYAISILAKNGANRDALAQAGAIPPLTSLVVGRRWWQRGVSQGEKEAAESALHSLGQIPGVGQPTARAH